MSDITERLRTVGVIDANPCPQCGAPDADQINGIMCEAADEIELLRGWIMDLSVANGKLGDENKLLTEEVGQAMVLLNNVTAEMTSARVEIKEMNRRIDMLRSRS